MASILYTFRVEQQHDKLTDRGKAQSYDGGMDYKTESGRRLKHRREELKLTLDALSKRTRGVLSLSRISNYEQGIRYMDPQAAIILARCLGVSAAWLMCVDDESTMSEDERQLLQRYRTTDQRGRLTIKSVAEAQNPNPSRYAPENLAEAG